MSDASTDEPPVRGLRALVLGASGFVGRAAARELGRRGARVTASGRDAARVRAGLGARVPGAEVLAADLLAPGAPERLLERARPELVLDLTGYGVGRDERDPGLARAVNAELPPRLARALASAAPAARLVRAGSALEYGAAGGDLAEDGPATPTTLYGETKLAGARAFAAECRALGVRGVTARLFMLYGPGERPGRLFPELRRAAREGAPLPLTDGRQRRDFTYVGEAAEGLVRLALAGAEPGAIVNVATGRLVSVRDFALAAARELGLAPELLRFGALPARAEEMEHGPVDVRRLAALTGWRPSLDPAAGVRAALRCEAEREAAR